MLLYKTNYEAVSFALFSSFHLTCKYSRQHAEKAYILQVSIAIIHKSRTPPPDPGPPLIFHYKDNKTALNNVKKSSNLQVSNCTNTNVTPYTHVCCFLSTFSVSPKF
jgi:hypothetical protein